MNRYVDQFCNSLFVRTVVVYLMAIGFLIELPGLFAPLFGVEDHAFKTARFMAILNFPAIVYVAWVANPVSTSDRRIFLLRLLWVYGPIFLAGNTLLLFVAFEVIDSQFSLLIAMGLFGAVAYLWGLISNPFARAWVANAATDLDAIFRAEKRNNLFINDELIDEMEIHIAPKLYYSFLAVLAAFVFIILETLLGEFIDDTFGAGGYVGASIIAMGIAVLMYPAHKRASKYVGFQSHIDTKSEAADKAPALNEVKRALTRQGALLKKYWLLVIISLVSMNFFVKWFVDFAFIIS